MPFFGQFGERGIEGHFKVRKIQNNWSNLFMCNFLDCVRYRRDTYVYTGFCRLARFVEVLFFSCSFCLVPFVHPLYTPFIP